MFAHPPLMRQSRRLTTDEWGEEHAAATLQTETSRRDLATHPSRSVLRDINLGSVAGSTCGLGQTCFAPVLGVDTLCELDQLVNVRNRLQKGETVFHAGDHFRSLFAIRSGSCKTVSLSEDGHEQVSGYYMRGEIIGTDGIGTDSYGCRAVALEDTEVCTLPLDRIEALGRENVGFQHSFTACCARDFPRAHRQVAAGDARRSAAGHFLLDLSQRYEARGYSASEFVLRMTRDEIGSYLGLKLETVSRLFSRFQRRGLVQLQGRAVKLLDRVSLRRMTACDD
jgi:CRP/FNR family transcriptional regulator